MTHGYGVKQQGLAYFKHFAGPVLVPRLADAAARADSALHHSTDGAGHSFGLQYGRRPQGPRHDDLYGASVRPAAVLHPRNFCLCCANSCFSLLAMIYIAEASAHGEAH